MDISDLSSETLKYYLSTYTDMSYDSYIITEAKRDYSYYELRVLLTMLFKYSADSATKEVLKNLLKTATRLEMMNVPLPILPKIGTAQLHKFIPTIKSKGRTRR